MRKGTVAATEMTTGWGLRTFTADALDKIHAATLDVLTQYKVFKFCRWSNYRQFNLNQLSPA